MVGSVTTAFCTGAKTELATGGHCFLAPNNQLANSYGNATCNTMIIGLTNTAVLAVGMLVNACTNTTSTTNVLAQTVNAVGAVISHIINSTAVRMDLPWSTNTSVNVGTVTFAGDTFYFGLINATPQFAWAATANCYGYGAAAGTPAANLVGSDELTSSNVGYTVGGFPLTNISPANSGTVSFWSFSANPSWTGATFSTSGGFIYNNSGRIGVAGGNVTNSGNGRMISIHSFGGTQSVSAGTFTVVLPTNGSGTSILQISLLESMGYDDYSDTAVYDRKSQFNPSHCFAKRNRYQSDWGRASL